LLEHQRTSYIEADLLGCIAISGYFGFITGIDLEVYTMPIAAATVIATSITFEAHISSFDSFDSSFNFVDRKSMSVVVDLLKIAG